MKLFGTDGIRGRANQFPMTPEIAMQVGRSLGRLFRGAGESAVVIGRDTRESGLMLEFGLTAGLISEGVDVIQLEVLPTPAVAYLTKKLGAVAGVMLTASHNPYRDNGIKIFGADGYKISDQQEEQIEAWISQGDLNEPSGDFPLGQVETYQEAGAEYVAFVKAGFAHQDLQGVKLVLDCGHGAASFLGRLPFEELGAEVLLINHTPDGVNINEDCGAMHPEKGSQLLQGNPADFAVSFDGDADRAIFCDETGKVVSGDQIIYLIAKNLHHKGQLKGETVVATVMSNLGLRDALQDLGVSLEVVGVGDRKVIERMREKGLSFGGENSGHLILSDLATTGDGVVSALQVATIIKESGKTLSQLVQGMKEYPSELVNLPVTEKPPIEEIPKLVAEMKAVEEEFGDRGRILIRYSGTENKMRILVEGREQSMVTNAIARLKNVVQTELGSNE